MKKLLFIKPMTTPEVIEIEGTLKELQALVLGRIEVLHCFADEPELFIICNEEGKFDNNCLPNRAILQSDYTGKQEDSDRILDILYGPFLIARDGEDGEMESLTPEQMEKMQKRFYVRGGAI